MTLGAPDFILPLIVGFAFQGGPGCSSFDGLMLESGPLRMKGGVLKVIEGGWDEYATLVFGTFLVAEVIRNSDSTCAVDQPPGTGYSYASTDRYIHELTEVTRGLYRLVMCTKLSLRLLVNIWNSCAISTRFSQNIKK